MAKETKKAVTKPAKTKKVSAKSKGTDTEEQATSPVEVASEVALAETAPVVAELNSKAVETPVAATETDWPEQEDPDSIGNRLEPGMMSLTEVALRAPQRSSVHAEPGEEYSLSLHFDKAAGQYVASILEFPEVTVTGPNRANVLLELQDKLETEMITVKKNGGNLPEPIQAKKYPEVLEIPVSQGLFRKLDVLSRQEKVALEKLVSEILASSVEKRFESKRSGESRPAQNYSNSNHQPRHNNNNNQNRDQRHNNNNNRDNRNHQQNRRPQGYANASMGGQDNFMEYVRNLEKGGGPGWKKR